MPPKKKVKKKVSRKNKFWLKLKGTYIDDPVRLDHNKLKDDVERLIAAVQQEIIWDDTDVKTWDMIQEGIVDWTGEVDKRYRRKIK